MHEVNLFGLYTDVLNDIEIQYFVTGSVAAIVYGEPRLTHDIDLVIHIEKNDLDKFMSAFDPQFFYCPPKEILVAEMNRKVRGHFILIHLETGFKGDIFLAGKEELQWWGMKNSQTIEMSGRMIRVAPPEYVIIKKLEYFKEGGSEKHLQDIEGIISNSRERINVEFLSRTLKDLGLEDIAKRFLPAL